MTRAQFTSALRQQRGTRQAASLSSMVAAFSGVALVALSGWFLAGAAMAGAAGILAVQGFNYLLPSAGIRALAIIRTLSRYGERYLGHRAALLTMADVRPRLFARLASADLPGIATTAGGDVATHLGGDIEALENLAIRRIAVMGAIAGIATGIAAASLAGWISAAILLAGLTVSLLAIKVLGPRLLVDAHVRHGQALHALKTLYAEYAPSSVELAIYQQARSVSALLEAQGERVDCARQAVVRGESTLSALQTLLAALTVAAMLANTNAPVTLQALAALAGAGSFDAVSGLASSLLQRSRVDAALGRLSELENLPSRETKAALSPSPVPPLTIIHHGKATTVQASERLRISGASGTGKTRLLQNMVGLRRDLPGAVVVGGVPASDLTIDQLRSLFAISAQEAPLIAGTIADNLRVARPGIADEALWSALAVACLDDTVSALPDGLNTWIGTDGTRLSGGQRKRLSLARALLAVRPWLVLDEPSEGLDLETERRLAVRLDHWLSETATGLILVNHRPGLDGLADRVIEL